VPVVVVVNGEWSSSSLAAFAEESH
jgi:hypothetical protein